MARHLVDTLEVHLETEGQAVAKQLMRRLSQLRASELEPLLQRVFEEVVPPEATLRLDCLELDLGQVSTLRFESEWLAAVEAELRRQLRAKYREQGGNSHPVQELRRVLELFVQTGNLPYWVDVRSSGLVAAWVQQLARQAPESLGQLLAHWAGRQESLLRLAQAVDIATVHVVVDALGAAAALELIKHIRSRGAEAWHPGASRAAGAMARGAVLLAVALERRVGAARALPLAIEAWGEKGQQVVLDRPALTARESTAPVRAKAQLGAEPHAVAVAAAAAGAAVAREVEGLPAAPPRPQPNAGEPNASCRPSQAKAAAEAALEPLGGLATQQLGLVMLTPFVPRFFQNLRLLDDEGQFVDAAAQAVGIQVVAFVASGVEGEAEHALALAKLLCGAEPNAWCHCPRDLLPEEREECDRLLEAVIQHAEVLKEMSTENFRATYLRREGVLCPVRGGWQVRADQKPQDILLERFPWSWRWVKLPWMSEVLEVQWP